MGDHDRLLSRGGAESDLGFERIPLATLWRMDSGARAEAGSPGRWVAWVRVAAIEMVRSGPILDLLQGDGTQGLSKGWQYLSRLQMHLPPI